MGCKGSGEKKHRYKVACASAHHKQVEDLMGAEIFMLCIENRHFQCIDNTADRIDNASCEKPSESRFGQCVKDLGECQHTQPSHADVDHGRNHFGQVIQQAFTMIPTSATLHTRIHNSFPV